MSNHNNNNNKADKKRFGSALEHGKAHQKDHAMHSRRSFIRDLGIAGSMSMLLGNIPLTALTAAPLSMALNTSNNSDRVLVLIRLKGGNDGLNTIIPLFDYGTYLSNRPSIAIPQNQIINLSDAFGIPDYMGDLESLWQNGHMKVVNNVGYPDQNLSHFRSTDIWSSASDANVTDNSGWMGRFLNEQFPDFLDNPPDNPPAIQIGGSGNFVFKNLDGLDLSVNVNNPDELLQIAQFGELYDTANLPDCFYGEQLGFIRAIANSTFRYAEIIAEAYGQATNNVEYQGVLGSQLAVIARLIKGGLGTRVYMVTLDGFDTHAGQNNTHPYLVNLLANNVSAFFEDLALGGRDQDVLAMTFSEFGRRIEQNASNGTDHGAAAPLMLFGGGLEENGFIGDGPDMVNVDQVGNLQFDTDFRQIYATVLENWLCVEPSLVDQVLGQTFDRMPELGISCNATSITTVTPNAIKHWVQHQGGEFLINYELPQADNVTIKLFNVLGQEMATLYNGYQMPGQHQVRYRPRMAFQAAGHHFYTIQVGRSRVSQKLPVVY